MARYLIRRLIMLIPVLLGISIIAFAMLRLIPGDPARIMAGERATEAQVQRAREKWGLDASYPMVAPNYAAARSQLAKKMGLGRKRK